MSAAERYGVIGLPVRHSLSPWIHAHFARVLQRKIVYAAYAPPRESFVDFVHDFFAAGGRGLNITVPFKADALSVAVRTSAFACRAGAVNVLCNEKDGIGGYNTDGAGLIKDLRHYYDADLNRKRVLIVGAGGAARAAAVALSEQGAQITVAARKPQAAAELATLTNGDAIALSECAGGFNIILNATSGGHVGAQSPLPAAAFVDSELAYDLNYGAAAAAFLHVATAAKTRADGSGMLLEQAALSFAIWQGVLPCTAALRQYLSENYRRYWQ